MVRYECGHAEKGWKMLVRVRSLTAEFLGLVKRERKDITLPQVG
jgi:hypothetical protein